jgi:REP element-mobilizing transposase RayT
MPRPLRAEAAGAFHHITTRAVARQLIFTSDREREWFLWQLGDVVERCGWRCHAYCLMDNHYHALIETSRPNLAEGMQRVNSSYAQHFNRFHARAGHLFGARYHSTAVQREAHLLEAARYIVLNPVRAGICTEPFSWAWSSYRATAGFAPAPRFLTTDWLLGQLGPDEHTASQRYRSFVASAPRP